MSSEKNNNKKYLLLIFLLTLTCFVLGFLLWREKQLVKKEIVEKTVYIEKSSSLESDLANLKTEYEQLQTDDESVKQQLKEKISQIEVMQVEAKRHKNDAFVISKLKKETETLRKIMKGFVVTIDSLNTANKNLTEEKEKISLDLKSEKKRGLQLIKEKEELKGVIDQASILKAYNIKIAAVKARSGGKEAETGKAKKADKIKVSFTLSENKITKPGSKTLYLRIITPDGKELTPEQDENYLFKYGENRSFYAAKESIEYNNQEYMVTMYAPNVSGFVVGKYIAEIYSEGFLVGETNFTLQ